MPLFPDPNNLQAVEECSTSSTLDTSKTFWFCELFPTLEYSNNFLNWLNFWTRSSSHRQECTLSVALMTDSKSLSPKLLKKTQHKAPVTVLHLADLSGLFWNYTDASNSSAAAVLLQMAAEDEESFPASSLCQPEIIISREELHSIAETETLAAVFALIRTDCTYSSFRRLQRQPCCHLPGHNRSSVAKVELGGQSSRLSFS